ncbi:MAG: tetratricopeptide repeat protein [Planctomycetes bacterium]|nr:tetratricopeptide repeat protein [Planctomycetota bacterium]
MIVVWACSAGLAQAVDQPVADAEKPVAETAAGPGGRQAAADQPGQADLNEAIDAKLAVAELDDFARVLDLCRQAIDKGLDEESRKFAEDLYTGTLIDRAGMLTEALFGTARVDAQWQRIRAFAMRDLEEAAGRDPKLGGVHLMIARLQALPEGDRDRAAAAAAKALALIGDDKLQRGQATQVLAELAQDVREKAAFYDAAVELAPRDADIRRARGLFRLVADQFDAAREDLTVAAEESPRDASVQEALGLACMMGDRLPEARAAFGRAIELAPEAVGPLLQRARILAIEGDREQALEDIDRAIDLEPGNPAALLLRARINQQVGDSDAALADIESILADRPDMAGALELRGLMAAEREDYAAAIQDFRRLAARDPDDPAILGQLGMLYLAAKQPRESIRRFTRALELDPENFPCRRGRSDAAISIGDHPAALADLEKVLTLKPDDSSVLNNLAWLLATSPDDDVRDGKRAIELATKACEETDWEEAHIISTLAAAHAEAGDFENARTVSRRAVNKGSDKDEVTAQLAAELASYEAGKPWRERQTCEEADEPAGGVKTSTSPEVAEPATPREPRRPFEDG